MWGTPWERRHEVPALFHTPQHPSTRGSRGAAKHTKASTLLDSVQTLFEKKMMMEAVNGEQVTFRRMDEILENVTRALELPLLQAERVRRSLQIVERSGKVGLSKAAYTQQC